MSTTHVQHLATRNAAGLFDFSFMGLYELAALAAIEPVQSRDLGRLGPGRIAYTLLLNEDGSVFNDATVWHLPDGRAWVFSGRPGDYGWIAARARARDRSGLHAVLALQGPASGRVLATLIGDAAVLRLGYFGFVDASIAGVEVLLGRLGYSGELGYELVMARSAASHVRPALLAAGRQHGLLECTFEAADSLRIEAGYVLFDRELTGRERPQELGLTRLVERPVKREAPQRRLVGLEILRRPAAAGPRPWLAAARVTSECDSPLFDRRIGLGFVAPREAWPGTLVRIQDGRLARVARLPFYDPPRSRPRATPL